MHTRHGHSPTLCATVLLALLSVFLALPAPAPAQANWQRLAQLQAAAAQAATPNGVASGTGVVATESGMPPVHHTLLTLTNVSVPTADHTTNGASGGLKIYTFPEGIVLLDGCIADAATSEASAGITATAALFHGLGTALAGTDDSSLLGTEANVIAATAGTLTSSAGTFRNYGGTPDLSEGKDVATAWDGHTTPVALYLNVSMGDASSSADGAVIYSGTIKCDWKLLGDYN